MNRGLRQIMPDQAPGKNASWHPFSPAFTWPARLLGALMLAGLACSYFAAQGSPSPARHPPLFTLAVGLFLFLSSFRQPTLRASTRGDLRLRKAICVLLYVLLAALVIALIRH